MAEVRSWFPLNFNNSNNQDQTQKPSFGEKLGFLAAIITTIGDILATVSAGIQIEEGIEEAKQDEQEKKEQEKQLETMQKQIDSLQKELKSLKENKKRTATRF